jgi:hypothetical protein
MPIRLTWEAGRSGDDSLSVSEHETSASGHPVLFRFPVSGKGFHRPLGTGIAEKKSRPTLFRPPIEIKTSETSDEE